MPVLGESYRELRKRMITVSEATGKGLNQVALRTVFNMVTEMMPYNKEAVDVIANTRRPGAKIGLNVYIQNHVGVCRHQALFMGYLLEKLTDDGILHGRASVDRNFIEGEGGHAWVRYVNSEGKVFILDTAQNYVGTLDDSKSNANWDYRRPKERSKDRLRDSLRRVFGRK